MLTRVLQRLFAKPETARAPLPEVLDLADEPLLRVIHPGYTDGFSALVKGIQGLFIINRHDTGVGFQLTAYGAYAPEEVKVMQQLVRASPPDPVVLDIGANIGIVSLALARAAGPGGLVHAFEAQRVIFHMLAGNMALNSMENVHCHFMAVGAKAGTARIPRLDYREYATFGSLELNREQQSDLGQQAKGGAFDEVRMDSIDAMNLPRVDMIKIDVEGMEADVLAGAERTIRAHRPLMYVEHLKSGDVALWRILSDLGYVLYEAYDNFVCIPAGDPRITQLFGAQPAWQPEAARSAAAKS
jgi:FkbM family methyltransferase